MPRFYQPSFKRRAVELIKYQGKSTKITAESLNVPLKTLENWITAYNKDNSCYDIEDKKIDLDFEY